MTKTFDVPVLLIFFTRHEPFKKVFECVKQIKPSKLYLYQDGPRGEKDMAGIQKCREIAADIDWACDVHQFYQEKNFGCDPSEYIAQKWMFDKEDRGIVLEDDDVVSQSFFYFCEELLEKYKDDQRINIICGMNHLGTYSKTEADYIFTKAGAITGWASWKRVIDEWDPEYSFVENEYAKHCLKGVLGKYYNRVYNAWSEQRRSGVAHYEGILGSNAILNSRLNIVPTKNMVKNIGLTADATHSTGGLTFIPRAVRCIFFAPIYEYEFPLKHPKYVSEDVGYQKQIYNIVFADGITRFLRRVEGRLYRLFPALGRWTLTEAQKQESGIK